MRRSFDNKRVWIPRLGFARAKMSIFFLLVKAVFTRLLFLIHVMLTLREVEEISGIEAGYFVPFCIGMLLLAVETVYTLIKRKGKEYRYFWPGGLCYLLSILPLVWVIELTMLNDRLNNEGKNAGKYDGLRKFSELGLILIIITGRWLLPRGEITRDQLSALLLTYVGTAADIMELFEVFEDTKDLNLNRSLYIAVLCTYTWSVLQFTFQRTATAETVADHDPLQEEKRNEIQNIKKRSRTMSNPREYQPQQFTKAVLHRPMPKYLQKLAQKSRENNEKKLNDAYRLDYYEEESIRVRNNLIMELREARLKELEKLKKSRFHGDLYNILVGIFMMDGPFLILRLIMIFKFGVTSDLHFLFTGKNAIAVSLLFYRLFILSFGH